MFTNLISSMCNYKCNLILVGKTRFPSWKGKLLTTCENGALISTHLPYDRLPRAEMVNQEDQLAMKEFSLERRNARQSLWRSPPRQLANDMSPQRERRSRDHGPRMFCPSVPSVVALVSMEAKGSSVEQARTTL